MIIQLDNYRKIKTGTTMQICASRRLSGIAAPKLRLAEMQYAALASAGPRLSDNFEGINTTEMLLDAYALATQI